MPKLVNEGRDLRVFRLHVVVQNPQAVANIHAATDIGPAFDGWTTVQVLADGSAMRPDSIGTGAFINVQGVKRVRRGVGIEFFIQFVQTLAGRLAFSTIKTKWSM